MMLVKPFAFREVAAHELPGRLRAEGHRVGIVTSSPRWYAETLMKQFSITADVLIAYHDTRAKKPDPEPIAAALNALSALATDAYHVGDAVIDHEASYHAGVTSIGAGWGVKDFAVLSSSAPDLLLMKPSSLLKVASLPRRGYYAEATSDGIEPKFHMGSTLFCGGEPVRYALGRYFTTSDPRHATSKLTRNILSLKGDDSRAKPLGVALGEFVQRLPWKPDYIAPVPSKPGQMRQRFEAVLHVAASYFEDTGLALDGLTCNKTIEGYKQMGAAERARANEDAYSSKYSWTGENVLVLDDVHTTGETADACARALMNRGAAEVRIVVFGKDQQVYARKQCPKCGRSMKVKTRGRDGVQFWGCSGWRSDDPECCNYTESI
jgi:hypothetical protein